MSSSKSAASPACLIDASIYIFRYYFSMPDNWFSDEGYATAAVYGYTTFLLQLLEKQSPEIVAACFDESLGSCFRNDIYADYKSSRALPDEALSFQLHACREVTELLGIASFSSDSFEADDLLGTIAAGLRRSPRPIAIVTRDKDLGQLLIREQDFLWDYAGDERLYNNDIEAKFGVSPHQLVDYLALVGDSIDDIPGVPGVGAKTAQILLQSFSDIPGIFANIDRISQLPVRGSMGLAEKLLGHSRQIALAQELARIVDDIPLGLKMSDLKLKRPRENKLCAFFERMGFGDRLMQRTRRAVKLA